jgi:hypothetical protein
MAIGIINDNINDENEVVHTLIEILGDNKLMFEDDLLFKRHGFSYRHDFIGICNSTKFSVEDVHKTMVNTPELRLVWVSDTTPSETYHPIKQRFGNRIILVNSENLIYDIEAATSIINNFLETKH